MKGMRLQTLVVEHFFSMPKILGSIPSTVKMGNKRKNDIHQ
jgi:hypothetical protein